MKIWWVEDEYEHILAVNLHKANIRNTQGRITVLEDARWKYPTIKIIIVDKCYRKIFASYINGILGKIIHIDQKIEKGLDMLSKEHLHGYTTIQD